MYPLSDKDMDRLSREAAAEFHAEPSPSGWEKLERELDRTMPESQKPDNRKRLGYFILIPLLAAAILSLLLTRELPPADKQLQSMLPAEAEGQALNHKKDNAAPPDLAIDRSPGNSLNEEGTATGSSASPLQPKNQEGSRSQPAGDVARQPLTKDRKEITDGWLLQRASHQKKYVQSSNQKPLEPSEQHEVSNRNDSRIINAGIEFKSESDLKPSLPAALELNLSPTSVAANFSNLKDPATVKESKDRKNSVRHPFTAQRFAIGITGGTDLSIIHNAGWSAPGYSAGLGFQYRIAPRWTVATGLLYTKKNYEAEGADYHPPKGYWTNNIDLDYLEGSCQMWEWPVNIGYSLGKTRHGEFFASGGISNYFMRRQHYSYYYEYNNNPVVRDWDYNKPGNYWMGIIQLAGAYEKRLSGKMSLRIEPYVKLPVKGVGFGRMDISSYGIYWSLQYYPGKRHM